MQPILQKEVIPYHLAIQHLLYIITQSKDTVKKPEKAVKNKSLLARKISMALCRISRKINSTTMLPNMPISAAKSRYKLCADAPFFVAETFSDKTTG